MEKTARHMALSVPGKHYRKKKTTRNKGRRMLKKRETTRRAPGMSNPWLEPRRARSDSGQKPGRLPRSPEREKVEERRRWRGFTGGPSGAKHPRVR